MKKLKLLLLSLLTLVSLAGYAQHPITSIKISLPANPPANTADWATAMPPVMITAQAQMRNGRVDGHVQESKILVTIKQGGSKKYGNYTPDNAPSAGFTTAVKNWSGSNATTLLGTGIMLPPGTYELCVQFFSYNAPAKPLSNEVCKTFTIHGPKDEKYNPPVNVSPVDKKIFTENEIKTPITFRWMPPTPKFPEPVTYKLRVWQLMQGQNATQAMRSNQPIITKDVENLTQTTVNNLVSIPCNDPWSCDFVWNVQALDREGKPIGGNNGTSEPAMFKATLTTVNEEPGMIAIKLVSPGDGEEIKPDQPIMFSWTPLFNPKEYILKIVEVKSGQSPEQAMKQNKAILEVDSIQTTTYSSGLGGRPGSITDQLVSKYAWIVTSGTVVSEVGTFMFYKPLVESLEKITLISPSNGEEVDPTKPIMFSWKPLPGGGPYTLKIVVTGNGSADGYFDDAKKENRAILEVNDIRTTTYSGGGLGSIIGSIIVTQFMNYAWIVTSGTTVSEVGTFRTVKPVVDPVVNPGQSCKFLGHPELIMFDSECNAIGMRIGIQKDGKDGKSFLIDGIRILELSKTYRDSLNLSSEEYINRLRKHLTNPEVRVVVTGNDSLSGISEVAMGSYIECWEVYCGFPPHGPNCGWIVCGEVGKGLRRSEEGNRLEDAGRLRLTINCKVKEHPEMIMFDSECNVLAMVIKSKEEKPNILFDEIRILELSKTYRDSLNISGEEYINGLRKHFSTGEYTTKAYIVPIDCWTTYCNNPNHGSGCGWQTCRYILIR